MAKVKFCPFVPINFYINEFRKETLPESGSSTPTLEVKHSSLPELVRKNQTGLERPLTSTFSLSRMNWEIELIDAIPENEQPDLSIALVT